MSHEATISTYDSNALELDAYFATVGSRVHLIDRGLEIAGCPQAAHAVEVGCGSGRDAVDIVRRVGWYEGIDPSASMINLARQREIPGANFVVDDALNYDWPKGLDVVYGFASFLHLNQLEYLVACSKIREALRPGGALVISLLEGSSYSEELVEDRFGQRMFYKYDAKTARELAGRDLQPIAIGSLLLKATATNYLLLGFRKN